MSDDLWTWDATDSVAGVRELRISAREVEGSCLARIAEVGSTSR